MKNQGCKIEVKTGVGDYMSIYPHTVKEQVLGWDIGEVYGPFDLTLYANAWSNNQQTVNLNGVTSNDVVYCDNFIVGDKQNKINQMTSYLNITNVESLNNKIRFTCKKPPNVNIVVQVWWTR